MLKFKSDIVSFRKQDNINAELYHQKYTWFLMSLNKLGKEEEYNFNDLDDIELEFEDKENLLNIDIESVKLIKRIFKQKIISN